MAAPSQSAVMVGAKPLDVARLEAEMDDPLQRGKVRQAMSTGENRDTMNARVYNYTTFHERQVQEEERVLREPQKFEELDEDADQSTKQLRGEKHRIMARAKMRGAFASKTSRGSTKTAASKVSSSQTGHSGRHVSKKVAAGVSLETTEMVLEEVLDTRSKNPLIDLFKSRLGIYRLEDNIKMERINRAQHDYVHRFPRLYRLVKSAQFDIIFGIIVTINAITIGIQTSSDGTGSDGGLMENIESAFVGVFLVELLLRIVVDSWLWLTSFGNVMDLIVVIVTGVVPLWLMTSTNTEVVRAFACLRALRLFRLVKILRRLPMMDNFWLMIRGVSDVSLTLVWSLVLFTIMTYIFAVFCVYLMGGKAINETDEEVAQKYFPNVPMAMVTVFQVACLDGWSAIARPVLKKSGLAIVAFGSIILVLTLIFMNLITAVIVKNAFKRSADDDELRAYKKRTQATKDLDELCDIFREIDTDGSGLLSEEEFMTAMASNDRCAEKFLDLGVSAREQMQVWNLVRDMDGGEEVSIDTFAETMRQMQGQALAKDSFTILRRTAQTNLKLQKLIKTYSIRRAEADKLRMEARVLREELGRLMQETASFVELIGPCIPSAAAPRDMAALARFEKKVAELSHSPEVRVTGPMHLVL
mmetsp:Transcript_28753/g.72791  ORF Transcript_28753/g.72791 Transcript_28753/m.72791 type:complete len:643 (-) Transcript_28753:45-1973(-)